MYVRKPIIRTPKMLIAIDQFLSIQSYLSSGNFRKKQDRGE